MQRKRLLVWGTALLVLTMSFTACLKTAELEVSPYDAMAMDPVVIHYYQSGQASLLAADKTDMDAVTDFIIAHPNQSFCEQLPKEVDVIPGAKAYFTASCQGRQAYKSMLEKYPNLSVFTRDDWAQLYRSYLIINEQMEVQRKHAEKLLADRQN